MRTPIFDFVTAYAGRDVSRFHMPGHKGRSFLGCEALDITEIRGADVLYAADGIIRESEDNASLLFGSAHTFYSAEGSTLAIKAMLGLVASSHSGHPHILAARNVHKAFVYACALLDMDVTWLYPAQKEHLCQCTVTAEAVKNALSACSEPPAAVYLTSPDYLGHTADIRGIADICRSFGVPLLVDNAHGAYLQFLTPSQHPLRLGAFMCCDSAHKTLPVLTGGAYLHLSEEAYAQYGEAARPMLSVFASTSPSYLILQSLDLCNRYLAEGYRERLSACARRTEKTKARLRAHGFAVMDTEPLKLVLHAPPFGYTGEELAAFLGDRGIEGEFCDEEYTVLMITPELEESDFARLEQTLTACPRRAPLSVPSGLPSLRGEKVMSIRAAVLSPGETVPTEQAEGRICAAPAVSCPPAIPIAISGERISKEAIRVFERYGITEVRVIRSAHTPTA